MAEIKFQGNPIHTCGDIPEPGDQLPDFQLVSNQLKNVNLMTYQDKIKVLNIVPSLDTPTCASSARIFNQKASQLENTVVLTVSADLPFAQSRFCQVEGIKDVIPLSCFRSNFAETYGIKLIDSILTGLTARAVIVANADNQVVYSELVEELADEPNYEDALAAVKSI